MALPAENPLFKLFGLANVFSNPGRSRGKAFANRLYRLMFLVVIALALADKLDEHYELFADGNIVLYTKVFLELITYWFTLYSSYVQLLLKDARMTEIRDSLEYFERKYRMSRRKRRRCSLFLWAELLTLLAVHITYYVLGIVMSEADYRTFISYFLNKFTVNLINYQFCHFLQVIHHLFQQLNRRLIAARKRIVSGMDFDVRLNGRWTAHEEIYKVRCHYHLLTNISRSLNEAYSAHIWFIVVNTMIENVCSLTGLLFVEHVCKSDHVCTCMVSMHSLLWFANFFAPVVIMIFSCTFVTDEANKAHKLVHDIEMDTDDELLTHLLEEFSLEINLNQFDFTGLNCFSVDKAILLTNVSVAINYLIVEEQFAFEGFFTMYTGF